MSFKKIYEENSVAPELGQYEKIKIRVGYSSHTNAYYANLTDTSNPDISFFVVDRSDMGWSRFTVAGDFLSSLHSVLDKEGMYVDGNEEELAAVISDLMFKYLERKRNESK